ncbi:MAG: peptidoglycan-associated lipoprotein Pal [Burkholderiales bacterium]
MRKALLGVVLVGLLTACAGTGTKTGADVDDRSKAPPGSGAAIGVDDVSAAALRDPNNILSQRSVYYAFDSAVVEDKYKPMVEAHAKFLTANPNARITLEGNCDERGSREYNLALGQQRANSVKSMMKVLGVSDARLETISYGEEKPKATGSDENAWAQNRRSDIQYVGE